MDTLLQRTIMTVPLRQQVYNRIEEMIVSGRAKPGDRLPENDLADSLKVSRGPVREALQLLERDGWVEVRPRHGAIVRRRSIREIEDLLDVRRILEVNAVRLAAIAATDTARRGLDDLQQAADCHARNGAIEQLIVANQAVHDAFTTICGNASLAEIVHSLGRRLRWYTKRPSIGDRAQGVNDEHRAVVEAILARDADGAAAAMNRHVLADWETYRHAIGVNVAAFEDVA
jgi:DNA-binding GntR family transcriptional regulator